ncbi:MAG: type II secretion system secretin GspD [Betaproteobacteria bacterium]
MIVKFALSMLGSWALFAVAQSPAPSANPSTASVSITGAASASAPVPNASAPAALQAPLPAQYPLSSVPANAKNNAPTDPALNAGIQKSTQGLSLNFVNADIEAVARTLGSLMDKTIVVDPKVKGTISLNTDKPLSSAQACNLFLASLRLQSFSVVEVNGLFKVLPEADAKLQGGSVSSSAQATGSALPAGLPANVGQVLTQVFRLQHENPNNLLAVLRPLISPNNTINVSPGSNALIITDYTDNLLRLAKIITSLDVPNASDVEVIPLKHAIALDLAPLVNRLIESGSALGASGAGATGQVESAYKTTLIAEPRSNAIILRAANPTRSNQAKALIEKLDRPNSTSASGDIHVVYLKNADATKLASTLRAAIASEPRSPLSGANGVSVGNPGMSSPMPPSAPGSPNATGAQTGGQIQADVSTNSLIITAPEPQFRQIRAVIDQLDGRRAQVMVESLIAEVDASKTSQFGIQWQNILGSKGGNVGVLGTNFGSGGNNLLNLALSANASAAGATAPGAGLNIGSFKQVNGVYVLSALANFLQQNGDNNILSTPTLLTLDNEEAKIVVGQNVPFVTGQYTSNNTVNGSVNPFQTIERKDVGLTLKVKPQISETGTVKLTIYQEVSSVDATSVGSVSGLITNKRSIESNILVEDGSVVVLGGLLSDEYDGNKAQVPGFGDIPYIGSLFRNETRTRKKTNLMVFLRPVVLRDANATELFSSGRYQQMMGAQNNSQVEPNPVMPIGNTIVLPPAPLKPSKP